MTQKNGLWLSTDGSNWTADMSELDNGGRRAPLIACPGCNMSLVLAWFTPSRDVEHDIRNWTLRHSCGARLTIFND